MAFRNAEGQRGKYLTLELSSTRNPVEDMYAVVSKFQSAKIGVVENPFSSSPIYVILCSQRGEAQTAEGHV